MFDKLVKEVMTKFTNKDAKNIDHTMIKILLPKLNEHILQIRWKGVEKGQYEVKHCKGHWKSISLT